jgi:hypothetical protein
VEFLSLDEFILIDIGRTPRSDHSHAAVTPFSGHRLGIKNHNGFNCSNVAGVVESLELQQRANNTVDGSDSSSATKCQPLSAI